jgi:hypothetical protein
MEQHPFRDLSPTCWPTNPIPAGAPTDHPSQPCLFFEQRKNSALKSKT